ncbi:chromosome segregation ATPase [Photobacterium nomapromontoriensis]|uniref:chromosome segregation ATPase n=1 Tax=Photobacterium nomapromontoriensis TaxID=2910237 RepID=UPI003D124DCC
MRSWKVSLVAGIMLGGVLVGGAWYSSSGPSQEDYNELAQQNGQLTAQYADMQAQLQQLETAKTLAIEKVDAELAQARLDLDAQKQACRDQLASLQKQQQTMAVTTKKLDTQVVKLTSTAEKQKVVLDNSKALYQQQLLLQKQVIEAKVSVKKATQVANEFKQACDEFKSGTSWNWVSQADCDKYEAKLSRVDEEMAQLVALEQELEELNQKIDIEIPRPE